MIFQLTHGVPDSMESVIQLYNRGKPFLAVIVLQFGYAEMTIICKFTQLLWLGGKGQYLLLKR
jgi:hypothetical protein